MDPFAPEHIAETEDEIPQEQEQQSSGGLSKEDLAEILAEQTRLNAENLQRVLQGSRPAGQPLQEEIRAPGLTLEGLPHPQSDLEGFYKGLSDRLAQRDQSLVEQVTSRTQQQVSTATENQSLFHRAEMLIREAAPDLADDVLAFSAQKIADSYRERGVNPLDALRGDLTGVAQEILDYADSRFGGAPEQPLQRKGGGRTQVLGGGGARAPRKPAPREPDATNVVQELRQIQSELRLY